MSLISFVSGIFGGLTMSRHLFAATASLVLSGCVYQPPGYWSQQYGQPYGPPAYRAAWYPPGSAAAPYAPPAQVAYAPAPAAYAPPAAATPYDPPPAAYTPAVPRAPATTSFAPPTEADALPPVWDARSGDESPPESRGQRETFAEESADYGIAPTNTLHLANFDAPTPTHIQGARTITTLALRSMLASAQPPVLIDVIGGEQTVSLPTAVWLRDAGVGRHLDDDVQAWFDLHLSQLTHRDKSHPVVFFCASRMCWLAHNATLRALDLGYTNVYWYRGGRDSWQAAGLPMAPVAPTPVNN
jgi:PQQ-dependent catabolism-associated CXXCW motif protein